MTQRVVVAPFVLFALSFCVPAFSQSLPDVATVNDLPATESLSPKYQRIGPIAINPWCRLLGTLPRRVLMFEASGSPSDSFGCSRRR